MNEDLYYCCDCWQGDLTKEKAEAKPFDEKYHGWHGPKDKHCIHKLDGDSNLSYHGQSIKNCVLKSLES
jgi:hypothetical protein